MQRYKEAWENNKRKNSSELGRRRQSNCKFPEKMAISPSNVLSRKKSGGGFEEEAGASCDAMPAQARRRRCRFAEVQRRRARGEEPEEEEGAG
jgi:hypothetical protein